MKMFVVVLLTCLFSFNDAFAQNKSFQNLIGKWEAVDSQNQRGGLEVIDSANVYLVYGNDRKRIADYKADFSKTPAWFDFTIRDESGTMQLKSLILFVNEDLIQWQVFESAIRPAHFTQNDGEMMYLRRKK